MRKGLILMLLVALGCTFAGQAIAQEVVIAQGYTIDQYVEAIYKAEGAEKATYLYGIRSVQYNSPKEARRICYNSVRNNIKRWIKAGKSEDFIVFMGRRYSPPDINPHWVRLVNYFLNQERSNK